MKNFFAGQNAEQNLGKIVRFLVIIAAGLALVGGCIYLFRNGYSIADYKSFKGELQNQQSFGAIFKSITSLNPHGILELSILLLIAIPILRVITFLISFYFKKNYLYTVISSIVLLILLFSFLYGSK